jgi:hypothetical protein
MTFERPKNPQTAMLEPIKPKKQDQTSSNQPNQAKPASSEQSVRARAKFNYGSTQLGRLVDARKDPNASESSVQAALEQTPTLDPRQTPIDAVDKIGFIDRTDGARLHAYPTGKLTGVTLQPTTAVTLIGTYRYGPDWSYIRVIQDNTMIAGWLQTARVNIKPPEPRAKLHLIRDHETAEQLARENFADHVQPGQDLRFYENVLAYINKQENRVGVEPAIEVLGVTLKGVDLKAGNLIWLVSPEFAKTLQNVVSNGSITGGAVAKARTANHAVTDTLESITQAIGLAPEVMGKDTWEAVRQNWRELLNGLLLFVGAEALSGALAVAPDPTMLSKIAASAIQFGLSAWGATGVVAAGGKSLEFGMKWLNTAIHANGDHKKIHQASLELIRMLEFMALTALAAFGAKGNAAKGLKIASEIKMPPLGGKPALAMADGGKLEPGQNNTNVNEARATQQTQSTGTTQTNTATNAARWAARIGELEPIYTKFNNWTDIKTKFLGKPASETNLPAGYKYARIGSKQYAYLAKTEPDKVPLLKTNIKDEWDLSKDKNPSSRLAEKTRYDAAYGVKILKTGSQIHHLVADNVWRGVEVYQEALRRGIAHMDVKANLIELAESPADLARARQIDPKFSEVLHQSQHSLFDDLVRRFVLKSFEDERLKLGRSFLKWTDAELLNFIKKVEHHIRDLFENHPNQLPKKSNGTLGFIPEETGNGVS